MNKQVLTAACSLFALTSTASAGIVSVFATDAGWYTSAGANNAGIVGLANTIAGDLAGTEFRSFYVFAIPVLDAGDQIRSATLRWDRDGTLTTPDGFETYALRSYEGSIADLSNGAGSFADLGDGTDYGEKTFVISGPDTMDMTAAAVAFMNANLGGDIAFGGIITTLGGVGDEWYRTNGSLDGPIYLDLDISQIPGPGSVVLLSLASLLGRRRRRAGPRAA